MATKIHLNYDHRNENGIIFNDKYPTGAMFRGVEFKPQLSFAFDSMQYSEVFDILDYVEVNGVKTVMSEAQANEVKTLATAWVQALGQEGNPTLDQARSSQQNKLVVDFDAAVKTISDALPHEMTSWRKQEEQARAWNADNAVATPIIDAILSTRTLGETKQQFVDLIIANANAYEAAYGALLGKFQKLSKEIAAAATVDAVNLIKWA